MIITLLLTATVITGFSAPEGSVHWADRQLFLVSNIAGSPTGEDGNGFISSLNIDGKLENLKFIDGGLDAPKGMVILDNRLYITDIQNIKIIDLNGVLKGDYSIGIIPMAQSIHAGFLNDITVDDKNRLYVSDTETHSIYRVSNIRQDVEEVQGASNRTVAASLAVFLKPGTIKSPNGILYDSETRLFYVLSWEDGHLYYLNRKGSIVDKLYIAERLDGIVRGPGGVLYISSWDGNLYRVTQGNVDKCYEGLVSPADITGLSYRGTFRLVVPEFQKNRVQILDMPK